MSQAFGMTSPWKIAAITIKGDVIKQLKAAGDRNDAVLNKDGNTELRMVVRKANHRSDQSMLERTVVIQNTICDYIRKFGYTVLGLEWRDLKEEENPDIKTLHE